MATITDDLVRTGSDFVIHHDPMTASLNLVGFDALDVDADWEMDATVKDIFRSALLKYVSFHVSNSATLPTPAANDLMGCVIERNLVEIWRCAPAAIHPLSLHGSAIGNGALIYENMPPFFLHPEDHIVLFAPTQDTNATPTVDLHYQMGFVGVQG